MTELKHYDLKNGFDSAKFYEQLHAVIACHLLTLRQAGQPAELKVTWDAMANAEFGGWPALEIEADYESLTVRLPGGGA